MCDSRRKVAQIPPPAGFAFSDLSSEEVYLFVARRAEGGGTHIRLSTLELAPVLRFARFFIFCMYFHLRFIL